MDNQSLFALAAFACDLYASSKYISSILRGQTRPHVFSWIVAVLTSGIAAAVSFYEGAWITGLLLVVACAINVATVLAGLRHGTKYISRLDCWAFGGALAAIPLWIATKEPFLAAVCVSTINALGDVPTLRKAWHFPFEENGEMFFLFAVISLARLLATEPLTWTTGFYPAAGVFLPMTIVAVVFGRRFAVKRQGASKEGY